MSLSRPLSCEKVNAYLWRVQHLDRSGPSVAETLRDILGVYVHGPSAYLGLLARIENFRRQDLDRELYQRRALGRMACMRNTAYILPLDMLPIAFQARRSYLEATFAPFLSSVFRSGIDPQRLSQAILKAVGQESLATIQITRRIEGKFDLPKGTLGFVIAALCAKGLLIRARTRGGWRSNAHEYALFKRWLPEVDLDSINPPAAQAELARRYLAAFSPATVEDFRWWAGFTPKDARAAWNAIGGELARVEIEGVSGDYWVRKADLDRLRSTKKPLTRVALLPVWDTYLMAYLDRSRYVDARWAHHIYDKGGNATSALLIDGRVMGIWDLEQNDSRAVVKFALFEEASPAVWSALVGAAERIARFVEAADLTVLRCAAPKPLPHGPLNSFMAPLKGVRGKSV